MTPWAQLGAGSSLLLNACLAVNRMSVLIGCSEYGIAKLIAVLTRDSNPTLQSRGCLRGINSHAWPCILTQVYLGHDGTAAGPLVARRAYQEWVFHGPTWNQSCIHVHIKAQCIIYTYMYYKNLWYIASMQSVKHQIWCWTVSPKLIRHS